MIFRNVKFILLNDKIKHNYKNAAFKIKSICFIIYEFSISTR